MSARTAHLVHGRDLAEPLSAPIAGGRAVAMTRCSPEKELNEDSLALFEVGAEQGVLAVADGLGGHANGAAASETVVRRLAEAIGELEDDAALRSAVIDGVERAQTEILSLRSGSGATLALAFVAPGEVRTLHAGDSGILVVGQRGAVRLQSASHSPTGYAVEAGLLAEEDALVHAERHLVSNYIGYEGMHLEVGSPQRLRPRDTVLVASDGVYDNLSTKELVELVRKGALEDVARELAKTVHERMLDRDGPNPSKPDDATFVLFRSEGA